MKSYKTTINHTLANPFVKWAGGKSALLPIIFQNLPKGIFDWTIDKYAEPFVGGGAVALKLISKFSFREVLISDINPHLILTYNVIKNNVKALIKELDFMRELYLSLGEIRRREFYYKVREEFNSGKLDDVKHAAYFIFLNKTCFNGLYRENKKGKFNVPFGRYKEPSIFNRFNLESISALLNSTRFTIKCGDFEQTESFIDERTFVYMDPPYRPVSKTANFTSYSKGAFGEEEQERLAHFFKRLDKKGAKLMLSNSFSEDGFFERLYAGFHIKVVETRRSVSAKSSGRGKIKEILVTNYEV